MIIVNDIDLEKNSKCYSDHLNCYHIFCYFFFQSVQLPFDAFVKKQMSAPSLCPLFNKLLNLSYEKQISARAGEGGSDL